jgi:hypothetical protein
MKLYFGAARIRNAEEKIGITSMRCNGGWLKVESHYSAGLAVWDMVSSRWNRPKGIDFWSVSFSKVGRADYPLASHDLMAELKMQIIGS